MKLASMKIQQAKGSCFIYLPKVWTNELDLKKGDKLECSVEEGNHHTLHLKKIKK